MAAIGAIGDARIFINVALECFSPLLTQHSSTNVHSQLNVSAPSCIVIFWVKLASGISTIAPKPKLTPTPMHKYGKSFTENSALVKHMRVHTGEGPYKCDMCAGLQIRGRILNHGVWRVAVGRHWCSTSETVPFNEDLLKVLVCPLTKQPLRYNKETNELISDSINVAYPVKNGIPNLVPQDGRMMKEGGDGNNMDT